MINISFFYLVCCFLSISLGVLQHQNYVIMSELKTKRNNKNVLAFLNKIENDNKKRDCFAILDLIKEISGEDPKMWGDSIIGFGDYHYKYKSGREGDWFKVGFSPRKNNIVLYFMTYFKKSENILKRIGKYKTGKSCFYINKLEDINIDVLKELIQKSYDSLSDSKNSILE